MSWLRDTERAARIFHEVRQAREGFAKPYVQPTPQYLFLKCLFCYPLRLESYYYMSLGDYTRVMVASEREVARKEGWESPIKATFRAREDGFVKDPPLVAAQDFPPAEPIAQLLGTYPVKKVLLYAELGRKVREHGWTWGHKKKRAIAGALASKPPEWHELQAMKYPDALRDLLRMVHPKPPSELVASIWRWALGKGEAPTERIKAYEEAVELAKRGDVAAAIEKAVEADLPWEAVRSRIGLRGAPEGALARAAERLMTANDVALQAVSLAKRLGESFVAELVGRRKVSLNAAARAALGLLLKGCGEAAEAFYEKAKLGKGEFESLLPMRPRRVVALVDVSWSMGGPRIHSAARILMPFREVFEKVYAFNTAVRPINLDTLDDFRRLIEAPSGGTQLYDSIIDVAKLERLGEEDLLFTVTDEQENYSSSALGDVLKLNTNVVEAVVAPYPADMLLKAPASRFVAYPASDPDAFVASARLIMAGRVLESEKVVELARLLPPIAHR